MPTFAQGRVATFMRHTYTWRQRLPDPGSPPVDETDEAWGVKDPIYAAPVAGKPCIYHDAGTELDAVSGELVRINPNMRVPYNDPITDDDLVFSILDGEGRVLNPGPLRVDVIIEKAPHGPLLWRVVPMRTTTVED